LIAKLEEVTGKKASHYLRREIFFAHQDFDLVIEAKNAGKKIFLYTGRGSSGDSLHLGHLLPMLFTVNLQKLFDCWVVIEMSDEEKFYFKDGTLDEFMSYTESNARDIIAMGFDPEKTFIFSSFKYERYMRNLVATLNKKVNLNLMNKVYGFNEKSSVGQISWPAYQIAPSMCGAFPHLFGDSRDVMCLVPMAVDQFVYFRSARDLAESMGFPKPAVICSKFLIGLGGTGEKASTTGEIKPIFLNDTPKDIAKKINRYAFSGGRATVEEHQSLGANVDVDVSYIYLRHFLEDDEKLKDIAWDYGLGQMLTGEIKKILIDLLVKITGDHQKKRAEITQETYDSFFTMKVQPDAVEAFKAHLDKYVNIEIKY